MMNAKSLMGFNRNGLTIILSVLIVYLIIQFNLSCSKKEKSDQVILAKVGNKVITVDEFRYNYEFGLPHLKKGPDPKKSYLDYMIKEELLALEGYKLGLDHEEKVQKLESELTEELLVEALFKKEVDEKITITPDEIKEAITKSAVKWKLRYWVEPSLNYANSVCQAIRKDGYFSVVDRILKSNPEVKMELKDFETGYLTWLDVPSEVMDAIKDLPLGEISDPLEMNGVYFIFQVVDIRQEPISDYEIQTKSHSFKKILFARKANERAAAFVSKFMTPKNVKTKGNAFWELSNAFIEWNKGKTLGSKNFEEAISKAVDEKSAFFKLKNDLNRTLVTFDGGKWSIKDFLDRFNENSIKLDSTDVESYRKALNQQIALKVRNYFFAQEARKRGLQKDKSLQNELQNWRDKWVYEAARNNFTENLTIDEEEAQKYFSKYKDRYKLQQGEEPTFKQYALAAKRDAYRQRALATLEHKIDSLKVYYPVSINQAVLDTIRVIDSKKSKWISLQVFKRGSNRMAVPIVDPAWIY